MYSLSNSTRHYGARCRDYKVQQIYEETIDGEMIFDRSRLFFGPILPQRGTTLIRVCALQDVTEMADRLNYPRDDIPEDIARYHAIYGPFTVDVFEEQLTRLFGRLAKVKSDTSGQFHRLHILKSIYSIAFNSIILIKECEEQLLLILYEDAFKYCESFANLESHPKGTECLYHIRRYIERVDELLHEYPHMVFRIEASLMDRFLEMKSYKHLRYGLQQFWMDPLRARVLAKHYDLYFQELWMKFMRNHFALPDCLCLHIIDWLLFAKTNTFVGESILKGCFFVGLHDINKGGFNKHKVGFKILDVNGDDIVIGLTYDCDEITSITNDLNLGSLELKVEEV